MIFDVEIGNILVDLEHLKSIIDIQNITVTDHHADHIYHADREPIKTAWKIVKPSMKDMCGNISCYSYSIEQGKFCNPSFLAGQIDYLAGISPFAKTTLPLICVACLLCLIFFGVFERWIKRFKSWSITFSDKIGLLFAGIIYTSTLGFLYRHNFIIDNFCLMNDDPICKNVNHNCFALGQLSEPLNSEDFEIGGFIDFDHKGSSFHTLCNTRVTAK